jgi:membrane protease YdiL (CAAX protease family)
MPSPAGRPASVPAQASGGHAGVVLPLGSPRPSSWRWEWPQALAGLALGFGPVVLLYAASAGIESSVETTTTVTVGSAAAIVVSSLVMYGWQTFAAWLFSVRRAADGWRAWGFRRPTKDFFWTIPLALLSVYVLSFVHDVVVNPEQQEIISEFPRTPGGVALFTLLVVVLAPLFEELFFRGFLFQGLANSWGWLRGAVVSGAVFGLAHLQLDIFVPLFALGFLLAWVYHRTGSLWTSIAFHSLFNGISVVAWLLTG